MFKCDIFIVWLCYRTVTKVRYATCHRDEVYCCEHFTLQEDTCIGNTLMCFTLPQEVLLYSDKASCRHSMTSQYFSWAEISKTYCDVTWYLQGSVSVQNDSFQQFNVFWINIKPNNSAQPTKSFSQICV